MVRNEGETEKQDDDPKHPSRGGDHHPTRAMSTSAVKKLADDARLCARKTREGKMEKLEKLKREKEEREQRRERIERSTRVHAGTSGKNDSERTPTGTKNTPRNDAAASACTRGVA